MYSVKSGYKTLCEESLGDSASGLGLAVEKASGQEFGSCKYQGKLSTFYGGLVQTHSPLSKTYGEGKLQPAQSVKLATPFQKILYMLCGNVTKSGLCGCGILTRLIGEKLLGEALRTCGNCSVIDLKLGSCLQ